MAQEIHSELPKQDNYDVAYRLACEELRRSNVEERCRNSGATLSPLHGERGSIELLFLNQTYWVALSDFQIYGPAGGKDVPVWCKILMLHYVNRARGTRLTGKQITFRQLPGGSVYYPAFVKRSQEPLIKCFGSHPELLVRAGASVGGWEVDSGDVGICVPAFPFVPVVLAVWRGDEEFPPEGSILFDSSITGYLSTEDVAVLCQHIVFKMIRTSRNQGH